MKKYLLTALFAFALSLPIAAQAQPITPDHHTALQERLQKKHEHKRAEMHKRHEEHRKARMEKKHEEMHQDHHDAEHH